MEPGSSGLAAGNFIHSHLTGLNRLHTFKEHRLEVSNTVKKSIKIFKNNLSLPKKIFHKKHPQSTSKCCLTTLSSSEGIGKWWLPGWWPPFKRHWHTGWEAARAAQAAQRCGLAAWYWGCPLVWRCWGGAVLTTAWRNSNTRVEKCLGDLE